MLIDAGARYVILGHSERRYFLGETDDIINSKIKAALKAGLRPILCAGEKEGEEMHMVLETQLTRALTGISVNQMKDLIIAYEPVWAVFTDAACPSDSALSASLLIKKIITKLYSRFLADRVPVIYGGSVDAKNAADYFLKSQIQGLLVGGASLDQNESAKIIEKVSQL
jgi:triosephosphate isomerase